MFFPEKRRCNFIHSNDVNCGVDWVLEGKTEYDVVGGRKLYHLGKWFLNIST